MSVLHKAEFQIDERGFLGRQCQDNACRGYFQIMLNRWSPRTSEATCPYCGYVARFTKFITENQLMFVASHRIKDVANEWSRSLKKMETSNNRDQGFGVSHKVECGEYRIKHYTEREDLNQSYTCGECGLRYATYGVARFVLHMEFRTYCKHQSEGSTLIR